MAELRARPDVLDRGQAVERVRGQAADQARVVEQGAFADEIRQAIVALLGKRFVAWWRAADAGGDVGVDQAQAIVAVLARGLVGEAGAVEGAEEPVAGAVAGEDSAGTVAA